MRHPVNKNRSHRAFKRRASKTFNLNVSGGTRRGGIRL